MSIAEVKGSNPIQARFLFKTAKVASITAVIFFQITLHPAGLIILYDFHIFITLRHLLSIHLFYVAVSRSCCLSELNPNMASSLVSTTHSSYM